VAFLCGSVGCSDATDDTAPATSVLVERPETARSAVVRAISELGAGPVETRTTGSAGRSTVESEAAADPGTLSMRSDEIYNDTIRTQFVLVDEVLYARIYPAEQDEQPFTVSSPGARTLDFYDVVFTAGGRVFGAVDALAAVFDRAPATVLSLGVRAGDAGDAGEQTGYRFVFDAFDIGRLLADERLESSVFLPERGAETTILEVWIDRGLRQLTTGGAVYQDGELIDDVELTIEFTPVDDAGIAIPTATLP
jgi:hypothetical protein